MHISEIIRVALLPPAVSTCELQLQVAHRARQFCIHPQSEKQVRLFRLGLLSAGDTTTAASGCETARTKLRGSAAGGGGELGRTYKAEEPHMCGATPAHTLQNDTPPSAISSAAGNLEKLKEPRDTPDHNFRKLLWRIIIFVFLFLFSQFLEES